MCDDSMRLLEADSAFPGILASWHLRMQGHELQRHELDKTMQSHSKQSTCYIQHQILLLSAVDVISHIP